MTNLIEARGSKSECLSLSHCPKKEFSFRECPSHFPILPIVTSCAQEANGTPENRRPSNLKRCTRPSCCTAVIHGNFLSPRARRPPSIEDRPHETSAKCLDIFWTPSPSYVRKNMCQLSTNLGYFLTVCPSPRYLDVVSRRPLALQQGARARLFGLGSGI